MKNILIINGHPDKESFCAELTRQYTDGALQSGAHCTVLHLIDLEFDPILRYGYRKRTELEADLLKAQEQIKVADHLVFVYPTWWGTPPALLKGFIDRVFLPGFAFKPKDDSPMWDKLLKGKTARLIVTMDAPLWYFCLVFRNNGHNMMKRSVLGYCGVKPVKITAFGMVKSSSSAKKERWKKKVALLGAKMN